MLFAASITLLLSSLARRLRADTETDFMSQRDLADIGGDAKLKRSAQPVTLRETSPSYDRVR